MTWETYDPEWLARLAEEQLPAEPWLPSALRQCTRCHIQSVAYYYFVDSANPNKEGSEWQFKRNIPLYHEKEGHLVLDILKGNRVGGVEFLNKIGLLK